LLSNNVTIGCVSIEDLSILAFLVRTQSMLDDGCAIQAAQGMPKRLEVRRQVRFSNA
jgi:hypothetical protein